MSGAPRRTGGSRFLYEPFEAALRIEAHERITDERWVALEKRLNTIETVLERLEKRLWLAVFGVVGFVLTQGVYALLKMSAG